MDNEYYFDLNREIQIYDEGLMYNYKMKTQGWYIHFLAFIQKSNK